MNGTRPISTAEQPHASGNRILNLAVSQNENKKSTSSRYTLPVSHNDRSIKTLNTQKIPSPPQRPLPLTSSLSNRSSSTSPTSLHSDHDDDSEKSSASSNPSTNTIPSAMHPAISTFRFPLNENPEKPAKIDSQPEESKLREYDFVPGRAENRASQVLKEHLAKVRQLESQKTGKKQQQIQNRQQSMRRPSLTPGRPRAGSSASNISTRQLSQRRISTAQEVTQSRIQHSISNSLSNPEFSDSFS